MPINPSIAMSYRAPDIQPQNMLADYAAIQQIQSGKQAQQLNALQMQEYQRARAEEEGVRNYLVGKDLAAPETRTGLTQFGKTGLGYAKSLGEAETAELTKKKTKLEISDKEFDLKKKRLDRSFTDLTNFDTVADVLGHIKKQLDVGEIDQATAQQLASQVPQSDAELPRFQIAMLRKTLGAKEQLEMSKQTTKDTDRGGYIERQTYDAQGKPVGEPVKLPKTATIGERTAQGQLGVAQQRLAQEGQGVTYQTDAQGNLMALPSRLSAGGVPTATPVTGAGGVPVKGKLSAFAEKTAAQKVQTGKDINQAIFELKNVAKEGGLIDQSTGSGAGKLIDIAAGFGGKAMPGAIAAGQLAPIADLVLKMVPRFEGPQSNKDTESYKQAAGQLADTSLPTKIRKAAANEIIRLMENRKNQFGTVDMAAEGAAPAAAPNIDALLNKYK